MAAARSGASADALAARVMGDVKLYLQSLCRLALDQDDRRLPAPARLFLSPEVPLLRRIAMLRDGSRKMNVSKKSLRWIVMMGLIVTGAIVASMRSSSVADEPAVSNPTTVDSGWIKYVDPNGPGVVVFRPAALVALPSLHAQRADLNRMFKDEIDVIPTIRGMGVSLDVIDCFAGPLQIQLRKNGEKGTGSITIRGVYCQLRTKADAEAWIKHCMFSVEKVEHKLGTYYKANDKPKDGMTPTYFLRPDERTIVFGQSEKEVLDWLAASGKPVSSPTWLQGVPNDTGIFTTAINMKNKELKDALSQTSDGFVMSRMFQPLMDHQGSVVTTLTLSDNVKFQIVFGCSDEEAAAKKQKLLDGMMSGLKMLMPAATSINGDAKESAEQQLSVDLITNLKSTLEGNIVRYTTHGTMKIGELLSTQIMEMKGSVEKK
ncbi:MAG: hypothetical protein QM703_21000 [Gemmatales bacterium]